MKSVNRKILDRLLPQMIALRHELHMCPELANQELMTSSIVSRELKNIGLNAIPISGTGLYAVLDSGNPGKTVALRAELDALPIIEETQAPYTSKNLGKMHACGHDGHMVTLLTVAAIMVKCKDQFKGKIKFIFQPAEETGTGSLEMINSGILENPHVDAIFGFHGTHRYETNKIATKDGCLMAGNDNFIIRLKGRGGYVSSPYARNNPIYLGALILQNLETIKNKMESSAEPIIISATEFNAADKHGLIPKEVTIKGSIRAVKASTQVQIRQQIIDVVMDIVKPFDIEALVDFEERLPPLINSSRETEFVLRAARNILEENNIIHDMDTVMAPEGFATYLEKIPGSFFFIGNGLQMGTVHKADYDFNDDIIQ
ncbi:MAG: amidohydrolase [Burkholderiales bacterium]|nr:amidohydrolase [Burkholderiales bacterium]